MSILFDVKFPLNGIYYGFLKCCCSYDELTNIILKIYFNQCHFLQTSDPLFRLNTSIKNCPTFFECNRESRPPLIFTILKSFFSSKWGQTLVRWKGKDRHSRRHKDRHKQTRHKYSSDEMTPEYFAAKTFATISNILLQKYLTQNFTFNRIRIKSIRHKI